MAEIQHIPKDWEKNIETHIEAMKASGDGANFLQHLETTFGSPQAFADYLRIDLQKKLNQYGLNNAIAANTQEWKLDSTKEPHSLAHDAKHLYVDLYRTSIDDGIAYYKAFYHANLSPTPRP